MKIVSVVVHFESALSRFVGYAKPVLFILGILLIINGVRHYIDGYTEKARGNVWCGIIFLIVVLLLSIIFAGESLPSIHIGK